MDTIKCIRCGAENQTDYKFCMNCGAVLPQKDTKPPVESSANLENSANATDTTVDFDGVSSVEMTAFVNNNANKILPKFYTMERFNQKVSFCFPVFFLGLIFGLFGISIWYFYRKMKKLGLISLALGLILFLADFIFNFNTTSQFIGGFASLIRDYFSSDAGFSGTLAQTAFNNLAMQYDSSYIRIFSFINQYVGGFICPVLAGMFSYHLYKEKAIKDIKELKSFCPEEALLTEISLKGGTSKGLLTIPILGCLLTAIIPLVAFLISFLSVI